LDKLTPLTEALLETHEEHGHNSVHTKDAQERRRKRKNSGQGRLLLLTEKY
jgi:hypothetical protein